MPKTFVCCNEQSIKETYYIYKGHRTELQLNNQFYNETMNPKTKIILILLAATLIFIFGCSETRDNSDLTIELSKNQTYEYKSVSGDEESARIKTQAKHFEISEIVRNSSTNFIAVLMCTPKNVHYVKPLI